MARDRKTTKAVAKRPAAKSPPKPAAPKQLPARAVKPKRPTKPSLPLPPPPPPPPLTRDELDAPRDIARLLRYGERFGGKKIDIRMLPLQLPVASGALAICDPGVPKSWKVLDRPLRNGAFRVMLSVVGDGVKSALAALTIHVGQPPIVRWTVAHAKGQKLPKSADQLPRWPVTTGWIALADAGSAPAGMVAMPPSSGLDPVDVPLADGRHVLALPCANGELVAYWGIGAEDKPVCLVVDFDVLTLKEWKAKPPR